MNAKVRYGVALLTLALCLFFSGPAYAGDGALTQVASFEGGTAYRTADDVYGVLNLSGTWRAMGRQYGALVKHDLAAFCAEITDDLAARGMDARQQTATGQWLAGRLSDELGELLDGMTETSGLTRDAVLRLNAGFFNLSDALLGAEQPDSCSGIAAWNAYTPDGGLVFGRNWDMMREGMQQYMKYLSVVVFHPTDGNAFANVHPLGNVYMETGINERGLFLELNNGGYSDGQAYEEREDSVSILATVLNRCGTVDEAAALLASTPADSAYIIQLADANRAVSIERPTFDCRVRDGDDNGLLVAYNSFIPPYPDAWTGKVSPPRDPAEDGRYDHLVNLANSERFFGKLDVDAMKELMDIGYQDGGAVHGGTVYQVIAAPGEMRLWMRGYGYSDWQQVDLNGLLTAR